ncbi:unnamed protein product [Sphagnum balticum]
MRLALGTETQEKFVKAMEKTDVPADATAAIMTSGNESFVFKRVPRPFYDLSLRLAVEFAGSHRLRMHIDCDQEEGILVYPYFRGILLALIQEDPDFPLAERKKILRCAGEAIQELHSKDWIHIEGNKIVTDTALGDFDIAFKLEGGKPRQTPYAIGNAMWRSPEGQTRRGVTKASDMFSFGPVVIPEGLLKQVNSEDWSNALKGASEIAEEAVKEQPELRFERWGEELGPEAQNMISGMTNLDPTARTMIDQVLTHRWWQEAT